MPRVPKGSRDTSVKAIKRARGFRRDSSVAESVFWEYVRNHGTGFKFRRQAPIGRYFLDFYCAEAKLCVELDGEQHADSQDYDGRRDAALAGLGIKTVRIPNLDLFEDTHIELTRWLGKIVQECEERSGRKAYDR